MENEILDALKTMDAADVVSSKLASLLYRRER